MSATEKVRYFFPTEFIYLILGGNDEDENDMFSYLDQQSTHTSIKHINTYTNMNTFTSVKSLDDEPLNDVVVKMPEIHLVD